jgi:2-keto-4-pentenoate hydratase/2-oxohepta-3-ene-1,7-dioic acid hydratase in catechol pathway
VAHDVSARDWQLKRNGGQWLLGKACDGFAPIGPAIVTPDEVRAACARARASCSILWGSRMAPPRS